LMWESHLFSGAAKVIIISIFQKVTLHGKTY
jgi:hypothetical protein